MGIPHTVFFFKRDPVKWGECLQVLPKDGMEDAGQIFTPMLQEYDAI